MNPVTQLEQSLTHISIPPGTYRPLYTPSSSSPPATITVSSGFNPSQLFSAPVLLMGAFGISLLATIAGSGTTRTLGVVGMLGTAGLFLAGVSQIH